MSSHCLYHYIRNYHYQLGGCSVNTGEHFAAIVMWHGKPYSYDGLKPIKSLRFKEYYPDMIMKSLEDHMHITSFLTDQQTYNQTQLYIYNYIASYTACNAALYI